MEINNSQLPVGAATTTTTITMRTTTTTTSVPLPVPVSVQHVPSQASTSINGSEEHQQVVTEAQLKWAQFHYRRRAHQVRQQVECMWQTPVLAADVEGALSEDGNTTEESASSDLGEGESVSENKEERQQLKAVLARRKRREASATTATIGATSISRGRRATLRLSKRAFARRRDEIQKRGFRCSDTAGGSTSDRSMGSDEDGEALAAQYADETAWKKARRNRRKSRRCKAKSTDDDRLRRFESAFHAMMVSLAASQQPQHPDIAPPTKVWSRPEDAPEFVSNVHQYLKWGVANNEKIVNTITTTDFAAIPVDRRSSWLVHIPSKQTQQDHATFMASRFPTNAQGEFLVPENINGLEKLVPVPLGSEKFNHIVSLLQQQAAASVQQMEKIDEQMEPKSRSAAANFKWQINGAVGSNTNIGRARGGHSKTDDYDGSDDYDETEAHGDDLYALDHANLKNIAAQYLSEFVANADEEHLIAVLGEKYLDNVETLIEAVSKDGGYTVNPPADESQDMVWHYGKDLQSQLPRVTDGKVPDSKAPIAHTGADNDNNSDKEERKSVHRDQMASFAGIAARYLAEVSRPRKIARTINSCRLEQAVATDKLKAGLALSEEHDIDGSLLVYNEVTQSRLESIVAKFIQINTDESYIVAAIVAELQRCEGKEFSNVVARYWTGVRQSIIAKRKNVPLGNISNNKESSRSTIANGYMTSLEKDRHQETELTTEEHRAFEDFAREYLAELCVFDNECEPLEEDEICAALRQEKRRVFSTLVTNFKIAVNKTIALLGPKAFYVKDKLDFTDELDQSHNDIFGNSQPIFEELGTSQDHERINQRTFEAIASRYLANASSRNLASASRCNEDAIFAELGMEQRQGFSRLVTRYLDENFTFTNGTNNACFVSRYIDSTRSHSTMYGASTNAMRIVTQNTVKNIIRQYATLAFPDDTIARERIVTGLPSHCGKPLIGLVVRYFASVSDCVSEKNWSTDKGYQYKVQGAVQKYLSSLSEKNPEEDSTTLRETLTGSAKLAFDTKKDNESLTNESVPSSTVEIYKHFRRSNASGSTRSAHLQSSDRNSESIAAMYLSSFDDCDEDDIFAELRKQESPKFVDDPVSTANDDTESGNILTGNDNELGNIGDEVAVADIIGQSRSGEITEVSKVNQDYVRRNDTLLDERTNLMEPFSRRNTSFGVLSEEKKTADPFLSVNNCEDSNTLAARDVENMPAERKAVCDCISQETQGLNSPARSAFSKSPLGHSFASKSEFSPERLRDFLGEGELGQTIIDTDGTTSEVSDSVLSPRQVAGLMLSPTILTKRHRQAMQAIENRKWDQVSYLLSANPWLAEMPEIRTRQYLLHRVAEFGSEAPQELCDGLVTMYPTAALKFDCEGNLPLHKASESCNLKMITILGERFPSGASVRNEDGMLPLHLAILASAATTKISNRGSLLQATKLVLELFPGALAVVDARGNLPLHAAAESAGCDAGIDVINFLLDEAEKQLCDFTGIRFCNKVKVEDVDSTFITSASVAATDIRDDLEDWDDQPLPPSMVVNDAGDTPLWVAMRRPAESTVTPAVVEALTVGPGGRQAALKSDSNNNNSLHLLLMKEDVSLSVMMSILKVAPEAVLEQNLERLLPIELASSMGRVSITIILELVLADLPIFLNDKACTSLKDGGESWWFLACECNDRYLDVVEELISICSYQQVQALCFMTQSDSRLTLISCASPRCREFLTVSLLFVGRFEFLESAYSAQFTADEVKIFDALDYGGEDSPNEEGKRVALHCYTNEDSYKRKVSALKVLDLDFDYVEKTSGFVVGERDSFESGGRQQFCLAIEQPGLTLDKVVAGMLKNEACKENTQMRQKYNVKILSVLLAIAKALHKLHAFGIMHGNITPESCGKFDCRWKLRGTLNFQKFGSKFDPNCFGEAVPPEALEPHNNGIAFEQQATFRSDTQGDPSIDIWGFGKLAYEVMVGERLIDFDSQKGLDHDHTGLLQILHWGTFDLVEARRCLRLAGVLEVGVDLITRCLSQDPGSRPSCMNEILRSEVWDNLEMPHEEVNLHEC